jgi:isochorismate hydrolase
MLIFDSNNIIKQVEYLNTLSKIEQEREYYLNEIKENQSSTNELISNIDKLERYAREKYLMKRENEDVFLIIDEADYTKDGEAKKEKK